MSFESAHLQPQKGTTHSVNVEKIHSENRVEPPRPDAKEARDIPQSHVDIGQIQHDGRGDVQRQADKGVELDMASLFSERLKGVHPDALKMFLSSYADTDCETTKKTLALWTGQTTLEELLS
jgi:hypothetical protein